MILLRYFAMSTSIVGLVYYHLGARTIGPHFEILIFLFFFPFVSL